MIIEYEISIDISGVSALSSSRVVLSGAPADTPWQKRLQITITVSLRTHKREKNVYKKKLFSIYTVYYVYCIYIEAYFFRSCLDFTANKFKEILFCLFEVFLASLPSPFLQIDHYLLRTKSTNLLKKSSQLNYK